MLSRCFPDTSRSLSPHRTDLDPHGTGPHGRDPGSTALVSAAGSSYTDPQPPTILDILDSGYAAPISNHRSWAHAAVGMVSAIMILHAGILQGNSGGFPNYPASDWLAVFDTVFARGAGTADCTDSLAY